MAAACSASFLVRPVPEGNPRAPMWPQVSGTAWRAQPPQRRFGEYQPRIGIPDDEFDRLRDKLDVDRHRYHAGAHAAEHQGPSMIPSKIAIVDYGAGNLNSVKKAFDYLGAEVVALLKEAAP